MFSKLKKKSILATAPIIPNEAPNLGGYIGGPFLLNMYISKSNANFLAPKSQP